MGLVIKGSVGRDGMSRRHNRVMIGAYVINDDTSPCSHVLNNHVLGLNHHPLVHPPLMLQLKKGQDGESPKNKMNWDELADSPSEGYGEEDIYLSGESVREIPLLCVVCISDRPDYRVVCRDVCTL